MHSKEQRSIILILTLVLASCSPNPGSAPKQVGFGRIRDSVYQNDFFGFALKLPAGWAIENQDSLRQAQISKVKPPVVGENGFRVEVTPSELQILSLFSISKHPVESGILPNPRITCATQRLGPLEHSVKTGKDFLIKMRNNVQASGSEHVTHSFSDTIKDEEKAFLEKTLQTIEFESI